MRVRLEKNYNNGSSKAEVEKTEEPKLEIPFKKPKIEFKQKQVKVLTGPIQQVGLLNQDAVTSTLLGTTSKKTGGALIQTELTTTLPLPEEIAQLSQRFQEGGKKLYVVGGAIRDHLLGRCPHDFDLATDASPEEVKQILSAAQQKAVSRKGDRFGVVSTIMGDREFEIASFRVDSEQGDGRRPDAVLFGTFEQDASRRDLTCNALYYDIAARKIIDHFGGIEDINTNRARVIGDPLERFSQDHLRAMRFIRFHCAMNDTEAIDEETSRALKSCSDLTGVAHETLHQEFLAGLRAAKRPAFYLGQLREHGLLSGLLPGATTDGPLIDSARSSVAIAGLLLNNPRATIVETLKTYKATRSELHTVRLLTKLGMLNPDTAVELKKEQLQVKVPNEDVRLFGEAIGLDAKLLEAFLRYEPSVKKDDPRLQGLTGQLFGSRRHLLEQSAFEQLLQR